jgi:hypothetical protein
MGSVAAPLVGHLDAALTNFAKKFVNNELIADRIAPAVPAGRQIDKYYIHGREGQELTERQLRASGAPAERIRISVSKDSYFARSHALAAEIPDEDREGYAEAGDIEQDSLQTMIEKILLQREDELATKLTDTAQVTNNITLAGAAQWNDDASTPGKDVQAGMDIIVKAGVRANFIAVGWPVFAELRWHPSVRAAFQFHRDRALTDADLAAFFGVEQFLVGAAVKMVGATPTFVWGKNALIGYVTPTPSLRDISGAKTFRWANAPGTMGGIGVVKSRHPDPTAKSDIVGVDDYYDVKITAVETLYLIKNAVA